MLFYDSASPAPNPRRVRIFLAEKQVRIPMVQVSIPKAEHKAAQFLAVNPYGQTPALAFDDGRVLTESVAICRYFEVLHPSPPLFGVSALEQAQVEMWIRRAEFRLMVPVGLFWRHAHPLTARLLKQNVEFGESNREVVEKAQLWLDRELADGRPYLTGDAYTMADITAQTTLDFADFTGLSTPTEAKHVLAWRERMAARPSASA